MKIKLQELRKIIREVAGADAMAIMEPMKERMFELADELDGADWDEQDESRIKELLAKHQEFMKVCSDMEAAAERLDPQGRDPYLNREIDYMYSRRAFIERMGASLEADLEAVSEMGPKVDARVLKTLYNTMKKGYDNSYAMLVDDAMNAGKKYAEKNGISLFWDAGVFPKMFKFIRAHREWDSIPESAKADIGRAARLT